MKFNWLVKQKDKEVNVFFYKIFMGNLLYMACILSERCMSTILALGCLVFDLQEDQVSASEIKTEQLGKRSFAQNGAFICFIIYMQSPRQPYLRHEKLCRYPYSASEDSYLQSRRRSLGRRRIAMRLIADENARVVSFSKRRSGLFKKATELSTLCGAQMALIVLSACGRAYSFGHPNVDFVTSRYVNGHPIPDLQNFANGVMLQQLKERCDEMNEELEAKKRKGKEIEEALANSPCQSLEEHASGVDLTELKQLKERLEKLLDQLQQHDVNEPHSDSDERPHSVNVDLSNVMNDGLGESPDWLKL